MYEIDKPFGFAGLHMCAISQRIAPMGPHTIPQPTGLG